jgi:hypothetical protein
MRLWQFLIAVDQMANTVLGGWADETMSARCYRNRERTRGWSLLYRGVNAVFFWMPDHCRGAYESEQRRLNAPPEYRLPEDRT